MILLASRGFHLGAKDRLYSTCICIFIRYGSETKPGKEEHVTRLEMNG